jgi:hypothetical protein
MTLEYFPSNDVERWLEDKLGDSRLALDDGSLWEVSPLQKAKVHNWVRFSKIVVSLRMGRAGEYRYVLVNTSYSEEAEARYLGATDTAAGEASAHVA